MTRNQLLARIARKKKLRQNTSADYRALVMATVRKLKREMR